jgi:hypothetical protein
MAVVKRTHWIAVIERAWRRKRLVWLSGVRRIGKTVLCQTLDDIEYFDCELPNVRRQMQDPEGFLRGLRGKRIVLDEVHRLANPSELLKIAADHYPEVKVIATGSSTIQASAKFRDALTGRKADVWLSPMLLSDLEDFGNSDLTHRLRRGGLPPFFLSSQSPGQEFQEWMDSYWARDIQELFRLERRPAFTRLVEMVFLRSGGIFTASEAARSCGVSHTTVSNYLAVLEATWVAHVIRPYSKRATVEIVAAPRVYAFDTGFVCHFRGWEQLRPDDMGILWEHFVLNEIQGRLQTPAGAMHYWRDRRGHEVDFVLVRAGRSPMAVECKWSASAFDPANMLAFRRHHPRGRNYVVAPDVSRPFVRRERDIEVEFIGLEPMVAALEAQ